MQEEASNQGDVRYAELLAAQAALRELLAALRANADFGAGVVVAAWARGEAHAMAWGEPSVRLLAALENADVHV
jgi:hypothetical protein